MRHYFIQVPIAILGLVLLSSSLCNFVIIYNWSNPDQVQIFFFSYISDLIVVYLDVEWRSIVVLITLVLCLIILDATNLKQINMPSQNCF